MKIFVYGTLMQGLPLHSALHSATPLGAASITGELFDLGPFPALLAGQSSVQGELYVPSPASLAKLDEIEGYRPEQPDASLYQRKTVTAIPPDGRTHQAQAYFYNRAIKAPLRIEHGDYRRYLKEIEGGAT